MTDRLGSVRATTDPSGAISAQYSYDAWGTPTSPAGNYGFTGEPQTTAGGGLLYLRARWYRPGSGRFLTTDPYAGSATTPASLHHYVYGADDPVDNTDPSGQCLDADETGCHDHDPPLAPKPFCFGFTCTTTAPQFMLLQHRVPTPYELGLATANNRDRFGRGVAMAPGAMMSELFGWDPPKGYECACIIPVVGMILADGGSLRGGGAHLEGESLALIPAKIAAESGPTSVMQVKGMVMPVTKALLNSYRGASGHTAAIESAIVETIQDTNPNAIAIVRNRALGAHLLDSYLPQKPMAAQTVQKGLNGARLVKLQNGKFAYVVSDLDVAAWLTGGVNMDDTKFIGDILPRINTKYGYDIIQHGTHLSGMAAGMKGASPSYLNDRVWVYGAQGLIDSGTMYNMLVKYGRVP